jgi:hypothetical protein
MRITIEVAPGELIDRITILEIKLERIKDKAKLINIQNEYMTLMGSMYQLRQWLQGNKQEKKRELEKLSVRLRGVNEQIWDIEDEIRNLERDQNFGPNFIETARSVYYTNDQRAELKREISGLFDSDIAEEKSYSEYKCPN